MTCVVVALPFDAAAGVRRLRVASLLSSKFINVYIINTLSTLQPGVGDMPAAATH